MHDIPNRIADVLLEVESLLRSHGGWDNQPPSDTALDSNLPFCVDTLSFEQWLQWIFLPRMKNIIEQSQPLPEQSGIYDYACEFMTNEKLPATRLLSQIKRFDDLISLQSNIRRH